MYTRKSFKLLIGAVLVTCVLIIAGWMWWNAPKPLISDTARYRIERIQIEADVPVDEHHPLTDLKAWDEDAVLECLSRCMISRPSWFQYPHSLNDVKIQIVLLKDMGKFQIVELNKDMWLRIDDWRYSCTSVCEFFEELQMVLGI